MKKSLAQWLYILENRDAQLIRLGLAQVKKVAAALHLLPLACPAVVVAGTNGKGSTVTALQSIYSAAGYRVGTYLSPHLLHFNERIQLNGSPITDEALCEAFSAVENACPEVSLTYFETTTLAALWFFKQQQPDVLVLEIGLGGRLDAVNVVDADVAIITTIDYDHQAYLGHHLDQIGFEKAGILRPQKPFIYADTRPPPQTIMACAYALGARAYLNQRDFCLKHVQDQAHFHYQEVALFLRRPKLQDNAVASALMAAYLLQNRLPVSTHAARQGLQQAKLHGRQQWLKTHCFLLLDVSHNEQSVVYLSKKLKDKRFHRIYAVFSALSDKDLPALIAPLKDHVTAWYPALLSVPRAAAERQLQEAFQKKQIPINFCYNTPVEAFKMACQQAGPQDLIIVYGSFFTVSTVLSYALSEMTLKELEHLEEYENSF